MAEILAADIGGTHCRFALFRAELEDGQKAMLQLERERWLSSADYAAFPDALAALRQKGSDGAPPLLPHDGPLPDAAVLAPAGPIQGEECRLSNIDWLVKASDVRDWLGKKEGVWLINDFAAQAYACLTPENIDAVSLLEGRPVAGAPIAVIGAGTGFGSALLLVEGHEAQGDEREDRPALLRRFRRARVLPCESGHALFPFVGEKEQAFARFAAAREGTERLVGDHVVTGKGLAHIYAFHTGSALSPKEATARAAESPAVLEDFARYYARAARNLTLSVMALGGLYITGGMALRLPALSHPAFAEELRDAGVQRPFMEALPVWHIRKAHSGLWGAALYGLLQLAGGLSSS